jgi:hypothetical protein
MFHTNQIFFKYLYRLNTNTNLYLTENNFYYLSLHLKLSSLFYSTQLIEIFAYETPFNKNLNLNNKKISLINNSILVYNFNSILFQQRFYLFILINPKQNIKKQNIN